MERGRIDNIVVCSMATKFMFNVSMIDTKKCTELFKVTRTIIYNFQG